MEIYAQSPPAGLRAKSPNSQRRRHQKSKTGVPVAPKKDVCPPKTLKKKKKKKTLVKSKRYRVTFYNQE